ncbi:hypothetical protein EV643_103431 [Kribbella sp. VKM Ac-2527]|uniref:Uncharacterized protein n=1 Tax=Kribbella caucasensis TaxID=2512215 RepID=A0A4V3CAP8_9ACTN|nr:hypothetical protein [Kribbella sp. VKM Ac-2527]TDO51692.1 hypothetical protein EV643_103431 [Kribbella sp. VKM Ac-2527]
MTGIADPHVEFANAVEFGLGGPTPPGATTTGTYAERQATGYGVVGGELLLPAMSARDSGETYSTPAVCLSYGVGLDDRRWYG